MARAGQRIWQILPLTVVDAYGCPYASPTAFAREPLYLSLDDLVEEGLLYPSELPERSSPSHVDWAALRAARTPLLRTIGERIAARTDLRPFLQREPWVRSWAYFSFLREQHGPYWPDWPSRARDLPLNPALYAADQRTADLMPHVALQWALDRQWARIRALAKAFDVELWGDLPFFVGLDSADVWARRELFCVTPEGRPKELSGVPPDAFSVDGQLWGHPQLDMAAHQDDDWSWWGQRVQVAHRSVDVLRIDHFRGLDAVWSVPAQAETAADGRWIPGPGAAPLQKLVDNGARLIAEDLGIITDSVRRLRDQAGLPGMAVLQFAFGPGGEAHFLPHAHRRHQVVYTGTHDNNTLAGWLSTAPPASREHIARYYGVSADQLESVVLRSAWRSVADTAILPMQDLLGAGSESRTNTPGTLVNNWSWRCLPSAFSEAHAGRLAAEALLSGRRRPS